MIIQGRTQGVFYLLCFSRRRHCHDYRHHHHNHHHYHYYCHHNCCITVIIFAIVVARVGFMAIVSVCLSPLSLPPPPHLSLVVCVCVCVCVCARARAWARVSECMCVFVSECYARVCVIFIFSSVIDTILSIVPRPPHFFPSFSVCIFHMFVLVL